MEKIKLSRLSQLFEKMVSDKINNTEKSELNRLYQDYINDEREPELSHSSAAKRQTIG